jgi:hypothetical protein
MRAWLVLRLPGAPRADRNVTAAAGTDHETPAFVGVPSQSADGCPLARMCLFLLFHGLAISIVTVARPTVVAAKGYGEVVVLDIGAVSAVVVGAIAPRWSAASASRPATMLARRNWLLLASCTLLGCAKPLTGWWDLVAVTIGCVGGTVMPSLALASAKKVVRRAASVDTFHLGPARVIGWGVWGVIPGRTLGTWLTNVRELLPWLGGAGALVGPAVGGLVATLVAMAGAPDWRWTPKATRSDMS